MTRKHYRTLAAALGDHAARLGLSSVEEAPLGHLTDAIITMLKQDNTRFDRTRFVDAANAAAAEHRATLTRLQEVNS